MAVYVHRDKPRVKDVQLTGRSYILEVKRDDHGILIDLWSRDKLLGRFVPESPVTHRFTQMKQLTEFAHALLEMCGEDVPECNTRNCTGEGGVCRVHGTATSHEAGCGCSQCTRWEEDD